MSYVIYNAETTILLSSKTYKTAGAAKAALTRAASPGRDNPVVRADFAVADYADFTANIEKQVERTNMMSGVKYMEAINTPPYMSPACDSYWSM